MASEHRIGINDDIKYYFADNEPIWFIGQSLAERKEINDSLNRESVKLDTLDDLIQNVELALVEGQPRASLIIMKNITLDMQNNFEMLVRALDAMPYVKVYEIDRDEVFKYGQYVPDIYNLKKLAFEKTRHENINVYTDPTDKQAEIMRSLQLDLEMSREHSEKLEEQINQYKANIFEMGEEIKRLTFDIDEKYVYKINELQSEVEKYDEETTNLSIDLSTERNKTSQYIKDLSARTEEISNKKYEIKALEEKLHNKDNNINKLKGNISKLQEEVDKLQLEQRRLLSVTVDEESLVVLTKSLEDERVKIRMLEETIDSLQTNNKTKDFDIKNLQHTISNLRDGKNDLQSQGRTFNLDTVSLNKTSLVYIKVFEELPYLKQYIKMLFDFISESKKAKGLLVVIKNDDGMDSQIFKGLGVISSFNDIKTNQNKYRLYPSSTMFNGVDSVEQDFDFVFVVDYIKSNNYYVSSSSREVIMTTVSHSRKIQEYDGLKGLPISNDSESIVDIKYSNYMEATVFKETRDRSVMSKVYDWYQQIADKI